MTSAAKICVATVLAVLAPVGASRAQATTLAGVESSATAAGQRRVLLRFEPAAPVLDVTVQAWGIELWAPGARTSGTALPANVVAAQEDGGARLRLEAPGAAVRGIHYRGAEVELLLSSSSGGAADTASRGDDYRIGVGDVLALSVYKNPDLSGDFTVGPDGAIRLPLIGNVPCAGKSESEVVDGVRTLLAGTYLVDPQVAVSVKTYQSQFVHIVGSVARASRVALRPEMTFKDVMSEAGVALAPGQVVVLSRPGAPAVSLTAEDLDADKAGNPRDADVLTVQERAYFVINGEVKRPTRQVLPPGLTLLEAIAMAEGFTDWASKKDVRILRRDATTGTPVEEVVNIRDVESGRIPDPKLRPGDVVLVRRRIL